MREELNWWFTNVYKQKRVITINPNTLVTSLIVDVCLFSNLSHSFAMISFFSCGSETVIFSELIMFPRKTISFVGTKIDLFLCTTKPSFVN
jgi:hypothetical protein